MRQLIVSLIILAFVLVHANERTKPVFRLEHPMAWKLKEHLLNRGWIDGKKANIKVHQNPDFLWDREYYLPVRVTDPRQIYNRISNSATVCNKTGLVHSLRSLYHKERSFDLYSFVPRAYVINEANESHDMERFIADFNRAHFRRNPDKRGNEISLHKPLPVQTIDGLRNIWIMKPEYLYGGEGIELMSTMEKFYAYQNASKGEGFIVQKYIEDPLLIDGKKFDIRFHAIVARKKPLVLFLQDDAYLRITRSQYDKNNTEDLNLHLTNFHFQSQAEDYDPKTAFWRLETFQNYLKNDLKQPNVWRDKIKPKIDEILITVLKSWPDAEGERENSFTMLGLDVMLDKYFNPWLLEVGDYPGWTCPTRAVSKVIKPAVRDMMKVMLDAPARDEWEKPGYPRSNPDLWGTFRLIYSDIQEGYKPSFRPFLSDKNVDTGDKKKKKKRKKKKNNKNNETELKNEKRKKKKRKGRAVIVKLMN